MKRAHEVTVTRYCTRPPYTVAHCAMNIAIAMGRLGFRRRLDEKQHKLRITIRAEVVE